MDLLLYHHIKELYWMPSVEQVAGTLPCEFKEKFPTTFAIIDGSEIFIETPAYAALNVEPVQAPQHSQVFGCLYP